MAGQCKGWGIWNVKIYFFPGGLKSCTNSIKMLLSGFKLGIRRLSEGVKSRTLLYFPTVYPRGKKNLMWTNGSRWGTNRISSGLTYNPGENSVGEAPPRFSHGQILGGEPKISASPEMGEAVTNGEIPPHSPQLFSSVTRSKFVRSCGQWGSETVAASV